MTVRADDTQVGGDHYKTEYQHWDFVRDTGMGYMEGQVVKYVTRWRKKGGLQDLEKAQHFLAKIQQEKDINLNKHLELYSTANQLMSEERNIIYSLLLGCTSVAEGEVQRMISDQPDPAEPTYRYVNQD